MAEKPKSMNLGKAAALSVTIFLLLLITPFSFEVRRVIASSLILGWLLFGILWLIRRFGKIAIVGLAILGVLIGSIGGYAYWHDGPNRELVARIKECRPYYIGTTGTILVGNVDYIYFDSGANDDDVRRFTELEGLNHLNRLVLKGVRISDATAKGLKCFSQLRHLYIEGSTLNDETIEYLVDELPGCRIEVK
jgi:hypothetical protein